MGLRVTPSGKPLGADIHGLDIAAGVTDEDFAALKDALWTHAVICVRGQQLSGPAQVEFARRFGPLQYYDPNGLFRLPGAGDIIVLSNIIEDGKPVGVVEAGHHWHTDTPYTPNPPGVVLLHAIEVPHDDAGVPLGGTMAASTGFAYESLPDELKQKIAGRAALHRRDKHQLSATRRAYPSQFDSDDLSCEHPLVRTHPATGRKLLYANAAYTVAITGMERAESDALLEQLYAHATRPEHVYTHRWQVGDLVIWDDAAIQHYALPDYKLPQRRRMHRATVEGGRPF